MVTPQEPLISIGMAFYNEARNLPLAIKSLLHQTYSNWELLLWDDGSTDESLKVARSFPDPRIHVYSDGEHRALGARMNSCLDLANGEYFARMDADDIAYPTRLATQIAFLQHNPSVDLVSSYVSVIDSAGRLLGKMVGPIAHHDIVRHALFGFRMIHPTWLGKLKWFRRYRYVPRGYAQDQELLFRAYGESEFAVIPKILLAYRQDPLTIRKLIRARVVWMHHLSQHLHGVNRALTKTAVGGVLVMKALVDVAAVATGLGYHILRHRARPLTRGERVAYCEAIETLFD